MKFTYTSIVENGEVLHQESVGQEILADMPEYYPFIEEEVNSQITKRNLVGRLRVWVNGEVEDLDFLFITMDIQPANESCLRLLGLIKEQEPLVKTLQNGTWKPVI